MTTNLLWHSNSPLASTGYGQQTALFLPRLAKQYPNTGCSAFYGSTEGCPMKWDGIPVYPGIGSTYGDQVIRDHAHVHFDGDIRNGLVVTLMDIWVLDPGIWRHMNVACWVPVDHVPCPPPVARFLHESGAVPIAMSKFGERMLKDAGLDPLYVPHGVDTTVYKPVEKAKARESIKLPADKFIVGMVAANKGNPSRKCFYEAFKAFKAFRDMHPDAALYLHTELTGLFDGVNLPDLIDHVGLSRDAVMFADQYRIKHYPFSHERMAAIYSSLDVLLAPSAGEGFGIPVIEAQACFPAGTPVRVEDPLAVQCRPYTGRLVKIETARGSFEATSDHPIWTQRGWQSAGSVRPGDQLLYSHAPERLDKVHAGPIEQVAGSLQDDAFGERGGRGRDDQGRSVLAASESRPDAEAIFGAGRDEAGLAGSIRDALSSWTRRRRGHSDDPSNEPWEGSQPRLQALVDRLEYRPALDGLGQGGSSIGLDRLAHHASRDDELSGVHGGPGAVAVVSRTSTAAGVERRLDGGGHRVVRNPAVAITTGPLDDKAARDRLAGPGAEYDSVVAVSERDVRDLPVYNFTTRSGVYEVGAGYLVHNCGVPVIVSDFSAQPELVGAGWLVKGQLQQTPIKADQFRPDVADIGDALRRAYAGRMNSKAEKARAFALQYDADLVMSEFMLPALAEVERRFSVQEPVTIEPREMKVAA